MRERERVERWLEGRGCEGKEKREKRKKRG